MKKIILFLFVCFTFEVMYAETKEVCLNQDPEKIELEEDDFNNEEKPKRSIKIVEVYLNRISASVVSNLYNIGKVTVKIENSHGDIVGASSINTDFPVTLNISFPQVEDTYYIELSSPIYRAYGYFQF
ncbi:MAG: hypothetical protein IJN06_08710 [Bacteroidales bacterium]|nr:hypothetical protein [Bacteroidales bacterium]